MCKVAILIAASPTAAFYSQVAALSRRLRAFRWSHWEPSVHVYVGGDRERDPYGEWRPHLRDVEIAWTSESRFARAGDWAQSDDAFRFAPRDADVLVAMDADTFPITSPEPLLDRVYDSNAVAGVIAHYPPILDFVFDHTTYRFSARSDQSIRATWARLSNGLVTAPLDFAYSHTLMDPQCSPQQRLTPFYLNFGMVLFPRVAFDQIAPRYLALRASVAQRMSSPDFSGQVALTLAIADTGVRTWALPMRYNFPNDLRAEQLYPEELKQVAIVHYLRTTLFDRHEIFASPDAYASFLRLELSGANQVFRDAVEATLGTVYPFSRG